MLAWLRRLIVSVGIGGASYAFMLGIMVLSVVYDQEFEPIITFAKKNAARGETGVPVCSAIHVSPMVMS